MTETQQVFGEDCCFELRGLLIEKTSYSFRHQVSHGFVTEALRRTRLRLTLGLVDGRLGAGRGMEAGRSGGRATARLFRGHAPGIVRTGAAPGSRRELHSFFRTQNQADQSNCSKPSVPRR